MSDKCDPGENCQTCSHSASCSADEKAAHTEQRLTQKLTAIKHKVMVMSGKGGVGKSTVAINLGAVMARQGLETGILDADIHGPNVPKMLGVDARPLVGAEHGIRPVEALPHLKLISMAFFIGSPDNPVVWRGPLKHSAIQQFISDVEWGRLDCLIIDLPPGTGDEALSTAHVLKKVDGSIIVTTPQDVALLDSRKAVNFSRTMGIPVIGIVENMAGLTCPHCGKPIPLFKVGGGEKAALQLRVPFLGRVPIDPDVVADCDSGVPVVIGHSHSPVAEAFEKIAASCRAYVDSRADFAGDQKSQARP
ncbi:MAG: Mrp/NBP35 family ATP-binding protein [Deltaproteobacteria bacterium]|nr:Mrp/NBP35 family ATP-binding protein [Deltaproteobacteria bacterium]